MIDILVEFISQIDLTLQSFHLIQKPIQWQIENSNLIYRDASNNLIIYKHLYLISLTLLHTHS